MQTFKEMREPSKLNESEIRARKEMSTKLERDIKTLNDTKERISNVFSDMEDAGLAGAKDLDKAVDLINDAIRNIKRARIRR